jgi:hypothetical protein
MRSLRFSLHWYTVWHVPKVRVWVLLILFELLGWKNLHHWIHHTHVLIGVRNWSRWVLKYWGHLELRKPSLHILTSVSWWFYHLVRLPVLKWIIIHRIHLLGYHHVVERTRNFPNIRTSILMDAHINIFFK